MRLNLTLALCENEAEVCVGLNPHERTKKQNKLILILFHEEISKVESPHTML